MSNFSTLLNQKILIKFVQQKTNMSELKQCINLKLFLLFNFCLVGITFLHAQNPYFRQSFTHRYLTNPAMVGFGHYNSEGASRIASGTKSQWLGTESNLFTQSLSYDERLKTTNASWGLGAFMTDLNSGTGGQSKYSHFSMVGTYAYMIPFKKSALKLGLSVQYSSLSFGSGQFLWEDQINATNTGFINPTQEPLSRLTKNVFHASAGAIYYSEKGFIGVAVHNINQPDISFFSTSHQVIERKIAVNAGYTFSKVFGETDIIPNAQFIQQGKLNSIQVQANFRNHNVQYGAGIQRIQGYNAVSYAMTNFFGIRYEKYYLAYSTDWNLNYNLGSIPLTHEFSIVMLLKNRLKTIPKFVRPIDLPEN